LRMKCFIKLFADGSQESNDSDREFMIIRVAEIDADCLSAIQI
jgi:hypothetical protein